MHDIATPTSSAWPPDLTMEEALHRYIDGELPFELQPTLFAHLAVDEASRRLLDVVLRFRRIMREEYLAVPPGVDDAFFKRLAAHQHQLKSVDRVAERRPIWERRTPISLRAAVVVAALLFTAGLLFPMSAGQPPAEGYVFAVAERVELPSEVRLQPEYVYVFYPGLDVEAPKEGAGGESL